MPSQIFLSDLICGGFWPPAAVPQVYCCVVTFFLQRLLHQTCRLLLLLLLLLLLASKSRLLGWPLLLQSRLPQNHQSQQGGIHEQLKTELSLGGGIAFLFSILVGSLFGICWLLLLLLLLLVCTFSKASPGIALNCCQANWRDCSHVMQFGRAGLNGSLKWIEWKS